VENQFRGPQVSREYIPKTLDEEKEMPREDVPPVYKICLKIAIKNQLEK
jgi:hypothetical protein